MVRTSHRRLVEWRNFKNAFQIVFTFFNSTDTANRKKLILLFGLSILTDTLDLSNNVNDARGAHVIHIGREPATVIKLSHVVTCLVIASDNDG